MLRKRKRAIVALLFIIAYAVFPLPAAQENRHDCKHYRVGEPLMHIELIAVGQKMPDWVNHGFADYAARFAGDLSLGLSEIPLQKRGSAGQLAAAQQKEAAQIKTALQGSDHIITLDIPGREYTSEALAARLQHWQENSRRIALIIGGPEGITSEIKALADESWSLGKLTLPHPLVRIIVAEALYRAWSINRNHPYHRA